MSRMYYYPSPPGAIEYVAGGAVGVVTSTLESPDPDIGGIALGWRLRCGSR
jgi:hypothetical protein